MMRAKTDKPASTPSATPMLYAISPTISMFAPFRRGIPSSLGRVDLISSFKDEIGIQRETTPAIYGNQSPSANAVLIENVLDMIPSPIGSKHLAEGHGVRLFDSVLVHTLYGWACGILRLHRKLTPFGATPGAVSAALRLLRPFEYNTVCQEAG